MKPEKNEIIKSFRDLKRFSQRIETDRHLNLQDKTKIIFTQCTLNLRPIK